MILKGSALELAEEFIEYERNNEVKKLDLTDDDVKALFTINHMFERDETFKDYITALFALYSKAYLEHKVVDLLEGTVLLALTI